MIYGIIRLWRKMLTEKALTTLTFEGSETLSLSFIWDNNCY